MNYLNNNYIGFGSLLLLIISCTSITQEELQQQYLEEKIQSFKAYKNRQCMKKILEKAELRADSFFVEVAKTQTFDSSSIPDPIRRPSKPSVEIIEDTLPLQPIIKDSLRKGQLPDTTLE